MIKQAVIMAGGEGVRLRPLTYAIPKPLLPLRDYTVIEYIIRGLAERGVKELFIMVYYQFEKFQVCQNYQKKYGVKIKLVKEGMKLGTIGGIINIKDELNAPFLVINADIINNIDVAAMAVSHESKGAAITLGVKDYSLQVPYGVVETGPDGVFLGVREKPTESYLISAGINVLSPDVFRHITGAPIDLPDLIKLLLKDGKIVSTHKIQGFWFDIGRAEDYEKAIDLLEKIENGK
ncbi:NTP transferase domain-containing protein [Candidatus Saganbacteria bacterium]|nr:NTP transferase domain-containing protein [Candidatus Saganbacteria bacterium]